MLGSIFGLNPTGEGVDPNVTSITPWSAVLAGFAVFGLAFRIRLGKVPSGLWVALAVVLTYWLMITLANRPPDSTRYLFVGAVAVFLIAASALRGYRISSTALIVAGVIAALAIPPNLAKFYDERRSSITDAETSRTEYGMLELARPHVHTDYFPAEDPKVGAAGAVIFVPLSADTYYQAQDEFGGIGYSLDQIRGQSLEKREIADATLAGALELKLKPSSPPADAASCPSSLDGRPGHPVFFDVEPGGVLLGSRTGQPGPRRRQVASPRAASRSRSASCSRANGRTCASRPTRPRTAGGSPSTARFESARPPAELERRPRHRRRGLCRHAVQTSTALVGFPMAQLRAQAVTVWSTVARQGSGASSDGMVSAVQRPAGM